MRIISQKMKAAFSDNRCVTCPYDKPRTGKSQKETQYSSRLPEGLDGDVLFCYDNAGRFIKSFSG